jgi:hypothetical protein
MALINLKGNVQQKLTWVKNSTSRWVLAKCHGVRAYFCHTKPSFFKTIFPFLVRATELMVSFGKISEGL